MAVSISNILLTTNVGATLKVPSHTANTNTAETEETPLNINVGETETTDNIQDLTQNKLVDETPENFGQTLAKKTKNKPADEKTEEEQDQDSKAENPDESLKSQDLLTPLVAQNIGVNETIDSEVPQQTEIQTSVNAIELPIESKIPQTPALVIQAVPKTDAVPVQPNTDKVQVEAETIVPEISDNLTIEPESISETAADTNISQTFSDNNKIANTAEKPVQIINQPDQSDIETTLLEPSSGVVPPPADIPVVISTPPSDQPVIISAPPSDQLKSKEAEPQTLISDDDTTADSEPAIVANNPDTTEVPEIQLPDTKFADTDNQNQQNPVQITEETTPKNTDIDQKNNQHKTESSNLPEDNKTNIETPADKPLEQKTSQSQIPSSASKTDNSDDSFSKQSSIDTNAGNEPLLGSNIQTPGTEHLPASASIKTANNTDTVASVNRQIQESITSSNLSDGRQIVIRLNPPELGKVSIKFTEQDNTITGVLQVDKQQTKNQIQQELPDIIQHLQDSGIAIKKIEVVLTNQEQHNLKDQSSMAGQNNWSGQQNSSNPEPQRSSNNIYSQWTGNTDSSAEFSQSQLQFNGSSINMLA